MIEALNVNKEFRKNGILPSWLSNTRSMQAVNNVTFRVKKGQVVGILGPNGCGKSTLIRMIGCLLLPDSGSIKVSGFDVIKESSEVKWLINRVSVEASFFKKLTVMENLLYAGRLYGLSAIEIKKRAENILASIGFPSEKIHEPIDELSRGLQQKIAITRGFLSRPKIVLLDEPTTGLDPRSKKDVLKFIRKYLKETGATVVLTSHDMTEVEKLCAYVYLMHKGAVIAQGSPEELKQEASDGHVYELGVNGGETILWSLQELVQIKQVCLADDSLRVHTDDIDSVIDEIIAQVREHGLAFRYLKEVKPSLEDVFISLTGASLEEENEIN